MFISPLRESLVTLDNSKRIESQWRVQLQIQQAKSSDCSTMDTMYRDKRNSSKQ